MPSDSYCSTSVEPVEAIAPWRTPGVAIPRFGAAIWRLRLTGAQAAALLAELDRHAIAVRAAAAFHHGGIWLYLWPSMANPGLAWLLAEHDAGAALVPPDQVRGGPAWACGASLRRLLRASRASEVGS